MRERQLQLKSLGGLVHSRRSTLDARRSPLASRLSPLANSRVSGACCGLQPGQQRGAAASGDLRGTTYVSKCMAQYYKIRLDVNKTNSG
jgi:hypothetical protein